MRSLKSSVLCFCAPRRIEMFKVISHTHAVHRAISIEKPTIILLLGIPERYQSYNPGCLLDATKCTQNSMHSKQLGRGDFMRDNP